MKKPFITMLLLLAGFYSHAEIAVQRTSESSYSEYLRYLDKNGRISFVQAYIHLASVTQMETPLLERCLEDVYLGAPSHSTCLQAVKSLASKPLNQPRREVLYSFLTKLEKTKSPNKSFYKELKNGLLRTHAHLAKTFGVAVPASEDSLAKITALEMKAWKKALGKKFPLEEIAVLINGKRISKLESWMAPEGVYQWALVSNTHEPVVLVSTFSQFAAESLKSMQAMTSKNCQSLKNFDEKRFGLLQMEIFAEPKCVAQYGMGTSVAKSDHLGSSSRMVKMEKSSSRHWVWPVLAIVGVGIASSLNGKQVSIQMPGAN